MKNEMPVFYRHKKSNTPSNKWGMSMLTGLALLALGAVLGITGDRFLQERQAKQASDLEQLAQTQLVALQQEKGILQSQLAIEVAAKEQFSNDLLQAQQTIHDLREDLTFFELLVPQEGASNTLQIRSAEALQFKPDTLTLKVLLLRLNRSSDSFEGEVHFIGQGIKDGKPASLALFPVQNHALASVTPMSISFSQFSRLETVLSVPNGFVVDKVTVRVQKDENLLANTTVNVIKHAESATIQP